MNEQPTPTLAVLLRRSGLVFVPEQSQDTLPESYLRAVDIKLAELGYAVSARLRARLARLPIAELTRLQGWLWNELAEHVGGDQQHQPLFRDFPRDIPRDTFDLWMRKVLSHFLQAEGQPCLFCGNTSTTHVLSPCLHVVCDQCFDGSNYSACPVCEHPVDTPSPFFKPRAPAALPAERVTFKLLDAGTDIDSQARELFVSFCARKQVLSPSDKDDFKTLIHDLGARVLAWLPEEIPVRENVAEIFGALFQRCEPQAVLPVARGYLSTATDVLRLIAVYSGADPALAAQPQFKPVSLHTPSGRFWGRMAEIIRSSAAHSRHDEVSVHLRVHRFKVARLKRPLRRALLALLEGFHPDGLVEDMLRHRSYWVWLGEFLHPHEYADRFPNVARAFAVVRKKAPDGTPAPAFAGYSSRLETAARSHDMEGLKQLLLQRPGEFARRYDHALRLAGDDARARQELVEAFTGCCGEFSTPVLLTLLSHLPKRLQRAGLRMYWPKGGTAKGVSGPDERAVLSPDDVAPSVRAIELELLRRFASKPAFEDFLIDEELKHIPVPFNERTASPSAVALPRGARVQIPEGKTFRLFLHWCRPEQGGVPTDIDLSVGFYTADWTYAGLCSFSQLRFAAPSGAPIAVSSGDLRDAPFPDGASEFVDVDRVLALAQGLRYAVMVVNNYAGLPFSSLERAFAGLMLRDDVQGKHFDPRTVELKFALQGDNGIFLPLAIDLRDSTLHWLDTYSKGELELNTVQSSNEAISKICPEMMEYFASGVRASMYDLALLHAAARGSRVTVRGPVPRVFIRGPGEDAAAFHLRLRKDLGSTPATRLDVRGSEPLFAALYRGDVTLPPGSAAYALFREQVTPTLSASDLLS
ncbi:hypothetical protein JY651_05860 [Pyxidicoccus parkwayensis]|uniref:RING-type domain-containing protein n=1 Tax=Pyxidicoccus parkwayensis TaxID=2813578 RepID=A0ABX7NZX9_9BACT|nr:MXAN_6230/SCO0854 family RING domain-containing protein [Pyxidicoccus parkwaysis]QSQ24477.1 hypothetical protein JY651_05860 [Pyxidicoccus parkwaysis]